MREKKSDATAPLSETTKERSNDANAPLRKGEETAKRTHDRRSIVRRKEGNKDRKKRKSEASAPSETIKEGKYKRKYFIPINEIRKKSETTAPVS